jgi:hypothetical protein
VQHYQSYRSLIWKQFRKNPVGLVALSPFAGARGLILREKTQTLYNSLSNTTTNTTHIVKNYFNGAGIQAGLGTSWNLFNKKGQWSIVGKSSLSIVQGVSLDAVRNQNLSSTVNQRWSYHENRALAKFILQIAAGIRWSTQLNNCIPAMCGRGKYPLIFNLTYEALYLPNIYDSPNAGDPFIPAGDLSFGGITLGGQFGF